MTTSLDVSSGCNLTPLRRRPSISYHPRNQMVQNDHAAEQPPYRCLLFDSVSIGMTVLQNKSVSGLRYCVVVGVMGWLGIGYFGWV